MFEWLVFIVFGFLFFRLKRLSLSLSNSLPECVLQRIVTFLQCLAFSVAPMHLANEFPARQSPVPEQSFRSRPVERHCRRR